MKFLKEESEISYLDPNMYVAYWDAHDRRGNVNRSTDIGVGQLKDVIPEGSTRNVVLAGTVGMTRVANVRGKFINRSETSNPRATKDRERREQYVQDMTKMLEEKGFELYRDDDRYFKYRLENVLPEIDAEAIVYRKSNPNTRIVLYRGNTPIATGYSYSLPLSKAWTEIITSLHKSIDLHNDQEYTRKFGKKIDNVKLPFED